MELKFLEVQPYYNPVLESNGKNGDQMSDGEDDGVDDMSDDEDLNLEDDMHDLAKMKQIDREQIANVAAIVKAVNTVDICFLLDCTITMEPWRKEVQEDINSIVEEVSKEYSDCTVKLAFVGYTDYECKQKLYTFDFTTNIESFKKYVSSIVCEKSLDYAEDVVSGLEAVIDLKWSAQEKIMFHICDAPCHGSKYHNFSTWFSSSDRFPQEDPTDRLKAVFAKFEQLRLKYCFIKINSSTDIMINKFRDMINPALCSLDVMALGENTKQFKDTVVASVAHAQPKK